MIWFANTQPPGKMPYYIKADFCNNLRSYGVYEYIELHSRHPLIEVPKESWVHIVYDKLPWEFLE